MVGIVSEKINKKNRKLWKGVFKVNYSGKTYRVTFEICSENGYKVEDCDYRVLPLCLDRLDELVNEINGL
jgi:hypothetical protein